MSDPTWLIDKHYVLPSIASSFEFSYGCINEISSNGLSGGCSAIQKERNMTYAL